MSELAVWMNGEPVASWIVERGTHRLRYEPSWFESERRRPLSLSLPLTPTLEVRGDSVKHYFDNLLPDSDGIRARLQRRHRTRSADAFDLLGAIGRDCVGAVQLLPPGMTPQGWDRIEREPLSEDEVERALRDVTSDRPQAPDEDEGTDFRISIAGAQEKTALLRHRGRWCRPLGATPTTHILKLPIGIIGGIARPQRLESVENEWLCMQLLRELGLPTARCEMQRFGEQKVLAVERFDRQLSADRRWIVRLPQEDFCQALGVPPQRKYENDGGPGIAEALRILGGSTSADTDKSWFLLGQLAFWMLAATDGHGKNFSLFLHAGAAYAMTPFYDVLSVYPIVGKGFGDIPPKRIRMAMGVKATNKHWVQQEIQPRHWIGLARASGVPALDEQMMATAADVPRAVEAVGARLPAGFPQRIWGAITEGMRKQAEHFLAHADIARRRP